MRCFVALALPPPLKKLLVQVQEALRRADADVKWVEEENLHLSLKFLGERDDEQLAKLKGVLSVEALRWPAMRLEYAGVGAFPDHGAPRVVWAGCGGDLEKLAALAAAIDRAAEQVGVPRERHPFVAHLTIGRVRSDRNLKRLQSAIETQRQVPLGRDEAREFVLFKSTLTPKGPIYEAQASFPLKGGRLDYVDGRPVAALVYQRRLHTINVFIWPSNGGPDVAPASETLEGYNILHWSQAGMASWAVSDVSADELKTLGTLLRK